MWNASLAQLNHRSKKIHQERNFEERRPKSVVPKPILRTEVNRKERFTFAWIFNLTLAAKAFHHFWLCLFFNYAISLLVSMPQTHEYGDGRNIYLSRTVVCWRQKPRTFGSCDRCKLAQITHYVERSPSSIRDLSWIQYRLEQTILVRRLPTDKVRLFFGRHTV